MTPATPSYRVLYALAVVVFVAITFITLVQAADPVSLGFSPLTARWLGIVGGVLGAIAGLLPRLQKPPDETRRGLD